MKRFSTKKIFLKAPRLRTPSFVAFLLAVTCLETSCSFNPKESSPAELLPGWNQQQIVVTLPQYPEETHPPLAGWQILCWKDGGHETVFLPPSHSEFSLTLEKNTPTAVVCYPLTAHADKKISFFRPAGCIYPYSTTAAWQEGFAAELFFRLAQGKTSEELNASLLLRFNWPRLTQQADKRFQQAQEKNSVFSPWFLQEETLKEAILRGTASTRNIKQHTLVEYMREQITQEPVSAETTGENIVQSDLYYRYIPLGRVKEKIIIPQNTEYAHHPENVFLQDNRILTLFTKKNQKPVLATTGVERYTEGQ